MLKIQLFTINSLLKQNLPCRKVRCRRDRKQAFQGKIMIRGGLAYLIVDTPFSRLPHSILSLCKANPPKPCTEYSNEVSFTPHAISHV